MNKGINFSIQWHITTKCLNRCKHCYMYDESYIQEECNYKDFVYEFENVKSFFDKYSMALPGFAFTGGSPLSHPDAEKILTFVNKYSKRPINIMDIPEVLTKEKIDFLKSVNVQDYQMSLDGLSKGHDEIRGKGSFERTMAAARLLMQEDIRPRFMFTLGKYNMEQLLPLCEYLVHALDQFSFAFDFVVPIGNAKGASKYLTVEEADKVLEEYYLFSNKFGTTTKSFLLKPSKYHVYDLYQTNQSINTIYNYPMVSGCHIGWNGICILQNGDVLPCRRLPIVLGNLKEKSFEDIFLNSTLLRKFRRYSVYQKKCGTCRYGIACRGCPAISYALFGDCFEKFALCSYQSDIEFIPKYEKPSIDCSSLEELEYIRTILPNYFLSNPIYTSPFFPKMVKYYKLYRMIHSEDEYERWVEDFGKRMSIEEKQCFMDLLSSLK